MVNKSLFQSITSARPRATTVNEAGGPAYKFEPKHALAQMAATGTFGNVFYASAQMQVDEMRKLIDQVDNNEFLAKLGRDHSLTPVPVPVPGCVPERIGRGSAEDL